MRAVQEADTALALAIGATAEDVVNLDPWPDAFPMGTVATDALLARIDRHPRMREAHAALEQARLAMAQGRHVSRWDPEIGASVGMDRDRDEAVMDFWLGFKLPMGARVRNLRAAAARNVSSAELHATAVRDELMADARSMSNRVTALLESLKWSDLSLTSAREAAAVATAAYQAGNGTMLEWLDAQQSVEEARLDHIGLQASALEVFDELDRWTALGKGVTP